MDQTEHIYGRDYQENVSEITMKYLQKFVLTIFKE